MTAADPLVTAWRPAVEASLEARNPATQLDIAVDTGASPATIRRVLDWLTKHGQVDELPPATSGGPFAYRLRSPR